MFDPGAFTILVVDDEEGIREVLTMNLEMDGFKVLSAGGALEAIDILNGEAKIDFILSDVRMPKGDGVSLVKFVNEKYKGELQVVLLSGFAEISDEEVKKIGALDLITKPPDIDHLIALIKQHCQK